MSARNEEHEKVKDSLQFIVNELRTLSAQMDLNKRQFAKTDIERAVAGNAARVFSHLASLYEFNIKTLDQVYNLKETIAEQQQQIVDLKARVDKA